MWYNLLMKNTSQQQYLVVSAIGPHDSNVLGQLTELISQADGNIISSDFALLGNEHTLTLQLSGSWNAIAKIEAKLTQFGENQPIRVLVKRTEPIERTRPYLPYFIQITCQDKPNIIAEMNTFIINEEMIMTELDSQHYPSTCNNITIATLNIYLLIPADNSLADLRERFMVFCDRLNLDATLEPLKN